MGSLCKKAIFSVLGAVLLCLPATAFAIPLDADSKLTDQRVRPLGPRVVPFGTPTTTEPPVEAIEAAYLSKDVVMAGKELLVSIGESSGIKLVPGATYEIFLDDVSLGTHTSDYNGQLFVQVKIPVVSDSGVHILKVSFGSELLLQKSIQIINN